MLANVGCYITLGGRKGFALPYEEGAEYEEHEFRLDKVIRHPDGSVGVDGFNFHIKRGDEKRVIIGQLFSNDDQIAIMLNKDMSEDDAEVYGFMQSWREWVGELVKKIRQ